MLVACTLGKREIDFSLVSYLGEKEREKREEKKTLKTNEQTSKICIVLFIISIRIAHFPLTEERNEKKSTDFDYIRRQIRLAPSIIKC
jgi:hypothetical protein